jgi:O-antigen ligase
MTRDGPRGTLARDFMFFTVGLAAVAGPVLAYGTLLLTPVIAVVVLARGGVRGFRLDAAALLFLAALALLTLAYALSARRAEDILLAFNFIFLLCYVPLLSFYALEPGANRGVWIADLALTGTFLALVLGGVEFVAFFGERVGRIASDPIRFGGAATILGFLSLLGLRAATGTRRWRYLAGPAMALGVIFMTGSRGPLMAFAVLALLSALMLARRKMLAVILTAGTAAAVAGVGWASGLLGPRMASIVAIAGEVLSGRPISDETLGIRFDIYQAGVKAFLDSPWVGHGWQRLTEAPQQYVQTGVVLAHNSHLHNDLLNFAVAGGALGILAYAAIIAAPLVAALRSPRDSLFGIRLHGSLILSTGYAVLGSSSLMLGFEYPTMLYVILAAILLGWCREPAEAPRA